MRDLPSRSRTSVALILVLILAACRKETAVPPTVASASTESGFVITRHDERVFAGGIAPRTEKVTSTATQDAKAAEAGAKLFSGMTCDGCHGAGAVVALARSLTDRPRC